MSQLTFDFGGGDRDAKPPPQPKPGADLQERLLVLAAQGRPLDEIARTLGLTTAQVRRRLRRTAPRERPDPPPAAALALPLTEPTLADDAAARQADVVPLPTEASHPPAVDPPAAAGRDGPSELTYEPADDWPPDEWTDPD